MDTLGQDGIDVARPSSTRDTVATETLASRATSAIVVTRRISCYW